MEPHTWQERHHIIPCLDQRQVDVLHLGILGLHLGQFAAAPLELIGKPLYGADEISQILWNDRPTAVKVCESLLCTATRFLNRYRRAVFLHTFCSCTAFT